MGSVTAIEDNYKAWLVAVGMICVTFLEVWAIEKGLDGTLFATVIGAILALVGLVFGIKISAKKTPSDSEGSQISNDVAVEPGLNWIEYKVNVYRDWFEFFHKNDRTDP